MGLRLWGPVGSWVPLCLTVAPMAALSRPVWLGAEWWLGLSCVYQLAVSSTCTALPYPLHPLAQRGTKTTMTMGGPFFCHHQIAVCVALMACLHWSPTFAGHRKANNQS